MEAAAAFGAGRPGGCWAGEGDEPGTSRMIAARAVRARGGRWDMAIRAGKSRKMDEKFVRDIGMVLRRAPDYNLTMRRASLSLALSLAPGFEWCRPPRTCRAQE